MNVWENEPRHRLLYLMFYSSEPRQFEDIKKGQTGLLQLDWVVAESLGAVELRRPAATD